MKNKKIERNLLAEIYTVVFEIYILSIRFYKIFVVCEYRNIKWTLSRKKSYQQ
jgi:hypothetical protein